MLRSQARDCCCSALAPSRSATAPARLHIVTRRHAGGGAARHVSSCGGSAGLLLGGPQSRVQIWQRGGFGMSIGAAASALRALRRLEILSAEDVERNDPCARRVRVKVRVRVCVTGFWLRFGVVDGGTYLFYGFDGFRVRGTEAEAAQLRLKGCRLRGGPPAAPLCAAGGASQQVAAGGCGSVSLPAGGGAAALGRRRTAAITTHHHHRPALLLRACGPAKKAQGRPLPCYYERPPRLRRKRPEGSSS